MRARSTQSLVWVSVFLLACSSGSSSTAPADVGESDIAEGDSADDTALPVDGADAADASPPVDGSDADPFGPYPPGPYGTKEGDVLANLDWEGYINEKADAISTTKTYGPTSLDKLRRSGKGFGLVHVSEFN